MRIDSCRKCGQELSVLQKCDVCEEPNMFECTRCKIKTTEKIHLRCYLISMYYHLLKGSQKSN